MVHLRFLVWLSWLIFWTSISKAQDFPIDSLSGKITYTGVEKVDSASADELYSRGLEWFARTFQSTKQAIDLGDRSAGLIKSSSNVNLPAYFVKKNGKRVQDGFIKFTLTIQCKEGRYRYTLTDLIHAGSSCNGGELERTSSFCYWQHLWDSLREDARHSMILLLEDLNMSMHGSSTMTKDDW